MKLLVVSLFAISSGLGFGYSIQDKQDKKPAGDAHSYEAPKPSPEHVMIQKYVGTFDAVCTSMGKVSKGTHTNIKHGDYFIAEHFVGEFEGQKFEGRGITGYDPIRKQHFTFWTDSMAPTPLPLWGTHDEKTHTTTMTGECMGMSGKLEKARTVITFKDADHYKFQFFGPGPEGKEMEHIAIEYTRKK